MPLRHKVERKTFPQMKLRSDDRRPTRLGRPSGQGVTQKEAQVCRIDGEHGADQAGAI